MKTLLFLLLAGSGMAACKKDSGTDQKTAGNAAIALTYKQPVAVPTGSLGTAQVTLTEVLDSRCPANAFCIWAGYAAVTVELTDAISPPQTVRLSLLNKLSPAYTLDSVAITLNQQAYWLRLVEVSPYPSTGTGSQPQTATLRLRPR